MENILIIIDKILTNIYDCNDKQDLSEKRDILLKVSKMELEDCIDYLIVLIDDNINNGKLSNEKAEKLLGLLSNLKVNNLDSIESLSRRLNWLKDMGWDHLEIGLKESHKQILEIFDSLNIILNKTKIDYYHTSGILVYLLTNTPLIRYHHDIDIFVNENDILKLKECLKETNFDFDIFLGKRTADTRRRTIKIIDKKYNIVISVFAFERLNNGAVIVNDYFLDMNNHLFATQDYNSPKCVNLSFYDGYYWHNDIPFKSITLEALYNCKKGRGKKHLYDCNIMEPFVNHLLEEEITREVKGCNDEFLVENEEIITSMQKLLRR